MQPEQQNNYWKNEADTDEISEMYTPEPVDDSVDVDDSTSTKPEIENAPVHWTASEYIHEEKNGLWFILFAIVALAFIAVDILFLKSYTFSVLVIVMAVAVVIYSRRPPRVIKYTLSGDQGLYVGENLYHFSEFKSFSLIKDDQHNSIMLIPIKRFAPGVSVYFPEEVGEEIVDILGARLPMEMLKLDLIDIIIRKLRL
ncbi:hypothetical protein COV88_03125 [Candidatus Saccharibacteria bacterium CG11_big_fil_rev_8_21_14_0_20_41_19]|nr:hypothetical protein [Candidatus Saccharibacteria bacterium]OIP85560.1 MAG: hypothetical protein AUK57_03585 [Candidatus Saccharibacteria bacterium CG2_30_41_52]PIQ70723.1 MAG: hypothetical protein COV88_03125 [Candidatus Saccharibacteria bacterium CG11_big_fil_rev_8_21_14_0_20_41_19]PIZ59304.1 MAG: hypothetical protein COY18_03845 [Candidatus Saccharibacteria bacterium CG_4_10_14_0_2_um_filter_41_11]PJC29815.1 MAG: hypothetical protein CO052_01375 [Candidatus Saccharibacteria bacterium CG_4